MSLSVSCPVESDTFSEGQTQRGMDRYLDSLFDPVLSDSSAVSTDTSFALKGELNISAEIAWSPQAGRFSSTVRGLTHTLQVLCTVYRGSSL